MQLPRALSLNAIVLCGLQPNVVSCMCVSGNTSALSQPYYPPAANCVEYTIPVSITSNNSIFDFPEWDDDYALEDFLAIATTRSTADFPSIITGQQVEEATYNIAASFCTPKVTNGKESTVILATHGIGLAREHCLSSRDTL